MTIPIEKQPLCILAHYLIIFLLKGTAIYTFDSVLALMNEKLSFFDFTKFNLE